MKIYANVLALFVAMIATVAEAPTAQAQSSTPNKINYQAVARNAAGAILAKQTIAVRLTIHSNAPTGAIAYQETHWLQTNQFGLFSVLIGGGDKVQGSMESIGWGATSHYLQVEMDAAGGSAYADMGTSELVSVPYALHARTAETALNAGSGGKVDTAVIAQRLELPVDMRGSAPPGYTMFTISTEDSTVTAIRGIAGGKGQNAGVVGESYGQTTFASGVMGLGAYIGVRGIANERNYPVEREVWGVWGSTPSSQNFSVGVVGTADADSGLLFGVYGKTNTKTPGSAGVFGLGRMPGVNGVHGSAEQAGLSAGVVAESYAQDPNRTALRVQNGYIRLGGGSRSAFVHTVAAANKINGKHTTELSYPGMEDNDVIFITRVAQTGAPSSSSLKLIGGKWNIFLDDDSKTLAEGDSFNVLVFKVD